MSLYPTRHPITTSNIEAAIAGAMARKYPDGAAPRTARVKVRIKADETNRAIIVENMSEDMRAFGEGMTRKDLRLLGYTDQMLDLYGDEANRQARQRAGLN